jgi:hypothetical protein
LLRGVIGCLKTQDGSADESLERRDIGEDGLPDREEHDVVSEDSEYLLSCYGAGQ